MPPPPRRRQGLVLAGTLAVAVALTGGITGLVLALDPTAGLSEGLRTGGLAGASVVALYGLWLNDRRRRLEEDRQAVEEERLRLESGRLINERFARAIEMFGSEADQVRVGAMHTLAGLARGTPSYAQTVIDVLCAYLRRPFFHRAYDVEVFDTDRNDFADPQQARAVSTRKCPFGKDSNVGEQKDRMLHGDWYLDEPDLAEERRRCWRKLDRFNATGADDDAERRRILEELLAKFGPGASVLPRFHCSYGAQISIGTNSFVNNDALFMDDATITIGDDVRIGPRAQLLTALHPLEDHERRRAGWERPAPITIGDNAWFGGGVIVCPGVTIGENAVIGAGSVVIRDIPDHVFAAGNPARMIRGL